MSFRDLCEPYLKDGCMMNTNKQIDGNVLLYTGTMFVLFHRLNESFPVDTVSMINLLDFVTVKDGLIHRAYKEPDWEDHDDYVGLMAASYFLEGGDFSNSVVKYGRSNLYCWNNQSPGTWIINGFFVRFLGFWALAKASSGRWVDPANQLFASIGLLSSFFSSGSSGMLLSYLGYNVFNEKSWLTHPVLRLSCVIFKFIYMKKHPKGIKESYSEYFGSAYPFANLPDDFF